MCLSVHVDMARRLVKVSDSGGRRTQSCVVKTPRGLTWRCTAARSSGVSRVQAICTTGRNVVSFGRGRSWVRETGVSVIVHILTWCVILPLSRRVVMCVVVGGCTVVVV